jgi:four helix bundle protein
MFFCKIMRDYKKYQVWVEAHQMAVFIYTNIAIEFPTEEKYELKSQVRRAAYSIPCNIAEGCGRQSDKDFAHFLNISLGSTHELEYFILLAKDLKYISTEKYAEVISRIYIIKAKLINLIKSIRELK